MAELIDKQAVLNSNFKCVTMTTTDGTKVYLKAEDVANHINSFPTVDAVEVVRCKDCKHMIIKPFNAHFCRVWHDYNGMGDEGFCNYGERREDDA